MALKCQKCQKVTLHKKFGFHSKKPRCKGCGSFDFDIISNDLIDSFDFEELLYFGDPGYMEFDIDTEIINQDVDVDASSNEENIFLDDNPQESYYSDSEDKFSSSDSSSYDSGSSSSDWSSSDSSSCDCGSSDCGSSDCGGSSD
jgi:hypothetical protein